MTITRTKYNQLQAEAFSEFMRLEKAYGSRDAILRATDSLSLADFVHWRAYFSFCKELGLNPIYGTPTPHFI